MFAMLFPLNNDTMILFLKKKTFYAGNKYGGNFIPHPYAFLCGVTQIAQMTQISFYFFYLFTFLPFKSPRKACRFENKVVTLRYRFKNRWL